MSPDEILAAIAAAHAVGPERRDVLRAALTAALARNAQGAACVRAEFDRFFPGDLRRTPRDGKARPRPDTGNPGRRPPPFRRPPDPDPDPDRERAPGPGGPAPRPATTRADAPRPRRPADPGPRRAFSRAPWKLGGDLSPDEERRVLDEIPRLLDLLRSRKGRRPRAARKGALWPQRAMRRALATDGVPFDLPRKARRPRRPRLVVLCDVSWSVRRAAALFVRLTAAIADRFRDTRIVWFVDRPAAARDQVNPDAPSDYGGVFHALAADLSGRIDRSTVLVVLGDGRTNGLSPLPWAFAELAARAGRTVWLVPEAEARWGTGDSELPAYLPHADVAAEVTDVEGLARGLIACLPR